MTDMLPDTLDEDAVSPGLKTHVLQQASAELETESRQASVSSPDGRAGSLDRRWPAWVSPVPIAALAALVMLVGGLTAWNIVLQVSDGDEDPVVAERRELAEAIASGASLISLSGTDAAPRASGSVVQVAGTQKAFLVLRDLPDIPSDREFQVWRISGDVPFGVGTFAPITTSGTRQVTLFADFVEANAIAISIEPIGGSATPTGDIILLGAR